MTNRQEIVPIVLKSNNEKQQNPISSPPLKPKVALRVKRGHLDATFYNGCDKYILYAVLKELTAL